MNDPAVSLRWRIMARPRSEQAHRAALDATVEVLREGGVERVTFEEVSARSGVAKSTLYRHFENRTTLIAKAARCCVVEHPTPDTGSLADDLSFLFGRFATNDSERKVADLLPLLIDGARRDPELEVIVEAVLAERRRPIRTVLQLAQHRGEIGADLDLDIALALVIGPFSYWRLVERREATPEFIDIVLHGAIAALTATAQRPATGAEPVPVPASA